MKLFSYLLGLLYPSRCMVCDAIEKDGICKKCQFILEQEIVCGIDEYPKEEITHHVYLAKYEGKIRELLIDYKFKDKSYYYEGFVKILLNQEKICGFLKNYDIIIPVPINSKRKRVRGYNQSELIAKELAKAIPNLILTTKVLYKIKQNHRQSELSRAERIQNVKNVYSCKNKEIIANKKIILFDDIYTTGSTVKECSKMLKRCRSKTNSSFNDSKRLNKRWYERNGRFSRKYIRLCKSRLYRLCHYAKW